MGSVEWGILTAKHSHTKSVSITSYEAVTSHFSDASVDSEFGANILFLLLCGGVLFGGMVLWFFIVFHEVRAPYLLFYGL